MSSKEERIRELHELRQKEKQVAEETAEWIESYGTTNGRGPVVCVIGLLAAALYIIDSQVMESKEPEEQNDEEFNKRVDLFMKEAGEIYFHYMYEEEPPTEEELLDSVVEDDPRLH